MRIHGFALLLLVGSASLVAAPPVATTPAGEIDVDPMARAKDVKVDRGEAAAPATEQAVAESDPVAPPSAPHASGDAPGSRPDGAVAPQDSLENDPATSHPPADEAARDEAVADDAAPTEEAGENDPAEPQDDAASEKS